MAMLRFHVEQRLLCIHQQITDRDADLGFIQLQNHRLSRKIQMQLNLAQAAFSTKTSKQLLHQGHQIHRFSLAWLTTQQRCDRVDPLMDLLR